MAAPPARSSKPPVWPERALHELLTAIVESSIDALVSKSTKGIILTWNPAAETLFGYRRDEAVGRHISLIIPDDRLSEEDLIMAKLLTGERISRLETQRRHRDGHLIPVELTISPIKDERGRVIGASKVARDLTELREAQARERRAAAERQKLEEELRQATAELELSNQRKDEFIATLAHELRNPLGAVRTSISALKSPRLSPQAVAETHAIMARQVGQICRLLDDLLDVSRITRGHLVLRMDSVDLRQVVDDAIAVAEPVFAGAGVTLHTHLSPGPLRAHADAARVQQMMDNMLNNAAKYTPRGGSATLSVVSESSDLVVTVSDTGIGIDADVLNHVFEMFVTVPNVLNHSKGGLGIGLCLVKRLAAMHGGDVTAHSEGLGRGSTFVLRLPVLVADVATLPSTAADATDDSAVALPSDERRVRIVHHDVKLRRSRTAH